MFVGAGAMATLVPECDIFLDECAVSTTTVSNDTATLHATVDDDFKLVPGLYKGCMAKIETDNNTAPEQYLVIKDNSSTKILFNEGISQTPAGTVDVHILAYGAPVPGPLMDTNKSTLLSDNWLGLVNTFGPPNVEVEVKQLSLAVSGTRNFAYQFKGSETVSGGNLDLSMNNASWLYYALGSITAISGGESANDLVSGSDSAIATHKGFYLDESAKTVVRGIGGAFYPPIHVSGAARYRHDDSNIGNDIHAWDGTPLTYTFDEVNGDELPSFALEVVYAKDGRTSTTVPDTNDPNENMYSRVFTGCQVNNFTINFEEGQEVKCAVDYVTRRAFDIPNSGTYASTTLNESFDGFLPTRGVTGAAELTSSTGLANFSTDANNQPFMFSDGSIKLFGQTYARVKSGSLAIANNLAAQRFVGNYGREVTSKHLPGQRTYEVSMNLLITDTKIWDELRNEYESTGNIELAFTKSNGDAMSLTLSDYLITAVTVPFPEDKGPIEVEMTAQARTLGTVTYTGTWGIVTIGGVASQN